MALLISTFLRTAVKTPAPQPASADATRELRLASEKSVSASPTSAREHAGLRRLSRRRAQPRKADLLRKNCPNSDRLTAKIARICQTLDGPRHALLRRMHGIGNCFEERAARRQQPWTALRGYHQQRGSAGRVAQRWTVRSHRPVPSMVSRRRIGVSGRTDEDPIRALPEVRLWPCVCETTFRHARYEKIGS